MVWKFFITNFQPINWLIGESRDEGIITGYYEPLLYGSLKKQKNINIQFIKFQKILFFQMMKMLKIFKSRGKIVGNKIVPYDTRKQIEKKKSKNPNYQIAYTWMINLILSFLHIQGSGKNSWIRKLEKL